MACAVAAEYPRFLILLMISEEFSKGLRKVSLHCWQHEGDPINNHAKGELHQNTSIHVRRLLFCEHPYITNSLVSKHTLKTWRTAARENSSFSATPDSPPAENLCLRTTKRFSSAVNQDTFDGVSWMIQNAAMDKRAVKIPKACQSSSVIMREELLTFEAEDPAPTPIAPSAIQLSYSVRQKTRESTGGRGTHVKDSHAGMNFMR